MNCSEVIVGSCIYSLLKSYSENKKLLLTNFSPPLFVDFFSSKIIIENQEYKNISDAWSMLRFLVSMRGLIINPTEPYSVRIEEDTIRFSGNCISFKKCHLFSCRKTKVDLDVKRTLNSDLYRVVDIMKLQFCNVENLETLCVSDSFVQKIMFFGKKKIVCLSKLTKEQINSFDFSDTISRFYVEKKLLDCEDLIRPLISPTRGHRKPKPIVVERVVEPLDEVVYNSTRKVKYYDSKDRINIIKTYCRDNTNC